MQETQSKTIFFWQAWVTGAEITGTETSFSGTRCNCLHNSFFCCNYSTLFGSNCMPLHQNNSGFNHCFFFIGLIRLGRVDSGGRGGAFLTLSILLVLLAVVFLLFSLRFSGKFRVTRMESWQFWSLDYKFFFPRVFY